MPFEVVSENGGRRVCFRYWGKITASEMIDSLKTQFLRPEDMNPVRELIADHSEVSAVEMEASEIVEVAIFFKKMAVHNSDIAMAVIAPSDLSFGLGRMWEIHLDGIGWQHMIFRSQVEAEKWLEKLGK